MRILEVRRRETMGQLARELGVTVRTIYSDITCLTANYPIDTVRGNSGCVKVADWYHSHKTILSGEQQTVLIQMLDKADEPQQKTLCEILTAFGSPAFRRQFAQEGSAYQILKDRRQKKREEKMKIT